MSGEENEVKPAEIPAQAPEEVSVAPEPVLAADLLKQLAPDLAIDQEKQKEVAKKNVARSLWRKHDLSWKLEAHQLVAYSMIKAAAIKTPNSRFVLNASRRWGKTYTLCCLAIEYALAHPNSLILYAGATQKSVKDNIVPTFDDIFMDAPANLRAAFKTQTNQYVFNNRAKIKLTGLDSGRLQKLRGMTAHLIIVDEAGFIDHLQTAVMSVLFPMTSTTGGQTILASNAPMSPGHDFVQVFTREAEENGCYLKQTILDVPKFTKDDIDRFAASCGGYESSTFQREYLCHFVVDEVNAVVPEWNKYKKMLVHDERAFPRPEFFYPLVVIDLGLVDFTGVLFGYWHFAKATAVIEDELLLKGVNSKQLVEKCRAKELELWGEDPIKPIQRVADGQPFTINDMVTIHKYPVGVATRGNVEAQANAIRLDVQACRLVINPKCVHTIGQIEDATWDRTRSSFTRDSKNGHFDLVAALQYFVKHVNRHSNPYPPHYRMDTRSMVLKEDVITNNSTMTGLKKIFAPKIADDKKATDYTDHMAAIFSPPKAKRRFGGV